MPQPQKSDAKKTSSPVTGKKLAQSATQKPAAKSSKSGAGAKAAKGGNAEKAADKIAAERKTDRRDAMRKTQPMNAITAAMVKAHAEREAHHLESTGLTTMARGPGTPVEPNTQGPTPVVGPDSDRN